MSQSFSLQSVQTHADWEAILKQSQNSPVILYKHSLVCGLSADAIVEMRRFLSEGEPTNRVEDKSLPSEQVLAGAYWVDVIDNRSLSQEIEKDLGIRHESPQVLFLYKGECCWHASHRKVNCTEMDKAWREVFS
jgi:bacillithiol system protein YtxJ